MRRGPESTLPQSTDLPPSRYVIVDPTIPIRSDPLLHQLTWPAKSRPSERADQQSEIDGRAFDAFYKRVTESTGLRPENAIKYGVLPGKNGADTVIIGHQEEYGTTFKQIVVPQKKEGRIYVIGDGVHTYTQKGGLYEIEEVHRGKEAREIMDRLAPPPSTN